MSTIQKYQINKAKEEAIKYILQAGKAFTDNDINKLLSEEFTKYVPGVPYYKPLNIEKFSISDKSVYNQSFLNLQKDLEAIYYSYAQNEYNTSSAKEYYDSKMFQVYEVLSKLSSEIEIAKEYVGKNIPYNSYIIDFFNLKYTNTKNLTMHNLPKTSCEMDFAKATVCNQNISSPSSLINISDAQINIKSDTNELIISGDVKDILSKDKVSTVSIKTITTKDVNHNISIDIDLKKEYDISLIELLLLNVNSDDVEFYISADGINYYRKENIHTKSYLLWSFEKCSVRYLRFFITKKDTVVDNYEYVSVTTIVNLSASLSVFESQSTFTSEKQIMQDASCVTIYPHHYIPPKCNINYFVGYEDKDNNVEWIQIKPGETVDLGLYNTEKMYANYATSEYFGMWDIDREKGKRLYYIHQMKKNNILNGLEVRAGYHQWLIERLDLSHKYKDGVPEDNKVHLNDYSLQNVVAIAPLDMNMNELRCEKAVNYLLMSCYVICEKEVVITDRYIEFDYTMDENENPIENFDAKVIVNGKEIIPSKKRYAFRLHKGENHIKIMILLSNHTYDLDNLDTTKKIVHNFNVLSTNNLVFAGPKMNRTSYNTINKYAHHFKLNQYAIKRDNDGYDYIITKFDPNYVLSPHDPYNVSRDDTHYDESPNIYLNNSEYMRMFINYKYMPQNKKEAIETDDGDSSIRLRLMARLISNDKYVTPYINNIKVVTT